MKEQQKTTIMDDKIAIVKRGLDKINFILYTEKINANMNDMIVAHIKTPMTISMNLMLEIAKEIDAKDVTIDAKGACRYSIIFEMK